MQFAKLELGGAYTSGNSVEINPGRKEIKTSVKEVVTIIAWDVPTEEDVFFIDNRLVSAEEFQQLKQSGKTFDLVEVLPGAESGGTARDGAGGKTYLLITKPEDATPASAAYDPNEAIFKVVEEMPRFPGCEDVVDMSQDQHRNCADRRMLEFIYDNLRYPASAREANIEGTVVISFIVEKDGKIKEPEIMRDIGGGCGDEVIRVVSLMPEWIHGKLKGEPVRVQLNLPVRFKLNENPAPASPKAGSSTLEVKDFNLYPNPSKGRFTLAFSAPPKPTLIQVKDAQGRIVLSRNLSEFQGVFREEFDLGKAPKGGYVVVIAQGDKVYTGSFVKQ